MATEIRLPPSAASLSTSMRDIGYSLETAIADLIDNSISASSTKVEIFSDLTCSDPTLAIMDNGEGMGRNRLIDSLRHGSTNPKQKREPEDLGRFGLGLKTSSFSQCRKLTVISAQNGVLSGAEWDLDLVDKRDDWIVNELDEEDLNEIPFKNELPTTGTIVIWRKLDRLFEETEGEKREKLVNDKLDVVERHLALVFHRFLAKEIKGRKKLAIIINGHNVEPFDPFCRKNSTTQLLPADLVNFGDIKVRMVPYILPHYSKLTASELDFYLNRSDFLSNQGAYIYRNGRLMAWGDWFRLIPKGDSTKLARVQIDFPSSLDELWTIDIKKSRAKPPPEVRERLRQTIKKITNRSISVIQGKGKKAYSDIDYPIWERIVDREKIRYTLNRNHPLVYALFRYLNEDDSKYIELFLRATESALPIEMIYSDFSTNPQEFCDSNEFDQNFIAEKLSELKIILFNQNECDEKTFRQVLQSMQMFESHPNIVEEFIRTEIK